VEQANQEEINSYIQERYFRRIIMAFNRRTVLNLERVVEMRTILLKKYLIWFLRSYA
jgi:hypothetical protein